MRSLLYVFIIVASLTSSLSFSQEDGQAVDQDGNSFPWKTYGDLDWAIQNATVVTFRDGTNITYKNGNDWNNKPSFTSNWTYAYNVGDPEKRLYDWNAVIGIVDQASAGDVSLRKQLAPSGWRVATKSDWENLASYLNANGYTHNNNPTPSDPKQNIAKSMAYTQNSMYNWTNSPIVGSPGNNVNTNNSSGFGAKPVGYRANDSFGYGSTAAYWCAYDPSDNTPGGYANIFYLNYYITNLLV